MIKIDWFSDDTINEYLKFMGRNGVKAKIKKMVKESASDPNTKIDFISFKDSVSGKKITYSIPIKTLLTGKREEVFEVKGIKSYMCLCRIIHNSEDKQILEEIHKDDINLYQEIKSYGLEKSCEIIKKGNEELKDIIKYDYITKDDTQNKIYNTIRSQLMDSLKIKTCPYCNRNYINSWQNSEKGKISSTAELDHFYQKDIYPLFALSLFNFVPSCHVCNAIMKRSDTTETIYPYDEGFENDTRFEIIRKGSTVDEKSEAEKLLRLWQGINVTQESEATIDIRKYCDDQEKSKRIEDSLEVFNLNDIYQQHINKALDTALKTRIFFDGSYSNYAETLIEHLGLEKEKNSSSISAYTQRDMEWLLFGYHWENGTNFDEPLSKMTYDIYHSIIDAMQLSH